MNSAAAYDTTNASDLRKQSGSQRSGLATAAMIIAVIFLGGVVLVNAKESPEPSS